MYTEKTKNNVKVRVDQEKLCHGESLNMVPTGKVKKGWSKPNAPFSPTRPQRKEILRGVLDYLFSPDGYAANVMRGLTLGTLWITGRKSHD